MSDYQSSHSGPTIDERVTLAATNQADIAALKLRMSSAENSINNKADTSTVNAALATKQNTLVSGTNIKTVGGQNVLGSGDIPVNDENAVKFVAQTLTDAQKAQARTNIDAASTEEVSQLEAKVTELDDWKGDVSELIVISESANILSPSLILATTGYIRRTDGVTVESSGNYGYTDFISVNSDGICCNNALLPSGAYGAGVLCYDEDKNYLGFFNQDLRWANLITSFPATKFVRFNFGNPASFSEGESYAVFRSNTVQEYVPYSKTTELAEDSVSMENVTFKVQHNPKNILNPDTFIDGNWIGTIGELVHVIPGTYGCFYMVSVKPNTNYYISNSNNEPLNLNPDNGRIAYYKENGNYISVELNGNKKSFTTPADCYFVSISVYESQLSYPQMEEGNERTAYEEYFAPYETLDPSIVEIPNTQTPFLANRISGEISAGASLSLGTSRITKNTRLVARIKGNIQSVLVGIGYLKYYGKWVEITTTQLITHLGSSGSVAHTANHGLTLGTNTSLIIIKDVSAARLESAKIILINDYGDTYTWDTNWPHIVGSPFIRNNNSSDNVTASLSYMLGDLIKRIWFFGDSYMTFASNARWPYYTIQWGSADYLINSQGGETAPQALDDFRSLIPLKSIPSFAVWCMGMNGGADENGNVNSSWLNATTTFISLCENNGIVPILATIPTIPNGSHTALNAWVRASGYRYIDFADAVEQSGTTTWRGWGTDDALLSSDQVHPTPAGAIQLAIQALEDFTELSVID